MNSKSISTRLIVVLFVFSIFSCSKEQVTLPQEEQIENVTEESPNTEENEENSTEEETNTEEEINSEEETNTGEEEQETTVSLPEDIVGTYKGMVTQSLYSASEDTTINTKDTIFNATLTVEEIFAPNEDSWMWTKCNHQIFGIKVSYENFGETMELDTWHFCDNPNYGSKLTAFEQGGTQSNPYRSTIDTDSKTITVYMGRFGPGYNYNFNAEFIKAE